MTSAIGKKAAKLKDKQQATINDQLITRTLADLARSGLGAADAKLMQLEPVAGDRLPYPVNGAYRIPYFALNGSVIPFSRYRRLDSNDEPKYQQQKDRPPLPYFEPVTKDWTEVAKDAKQPMAFVEGEKKAVATARALGLPCVGLSGTHSFQSKKRNLALLEGLFEFVFAERTVYIIFDRSMPANAATLQATFSLAIKLLELGAHVYVVTLPVLRDGQTGVDDFLVAGKDLPKLLEATKEWLGWPYTDQGNAERFAFTHGENLRCVARSDSETGGRWYAWDGKVWIADVLLARQRLSQNMPAEMRRDAMKRGASDKGIEAIAALCSAGRIRATIALARSIPPIPTRPEDFDADETKMLLNCENGTLDLDTLTLREHQREDMLTRMVRAAYDPKAQAVRWEKALVEWTGDKEVVRTLQQLVGLSLTGVTTKHLFIIMQGDGQTGKTTFQEAIMYLLNGYGGAISSDHLVLQKNAAPDERKAVKLVGLRFVASSETKQGGTLDENFVKLITGGDTLEARNLYYEAFDFKPQAKYWLRTNNPLTIRGTDHAIWRRIVQILFTRIVKKPDLKLPAKLQGEAAGILAWAVRGWKDYRDNGLYLAPSIVSATEDYRREQDVLGAFVAEECDLDQSYSVGKRLLYSKYEPWAKGGKFFQKNIREFGSELKRRFELDESTPTDKVTGLKMEHWNGLRLKPEGRQKHEG